MTLTSDTGSFDGFLRFTRLPRRSLQVYWPEANGLIAAGVEHREANSKVPDYNAVVTVTPRVVTAGGHRRVFPYTHDRD